MTRSTLAILALILLSMQAVAQFDLRPPGPFNKRDLKPNQQTFLEVVNVDPNLVVDEYSFQIYVDEGGTRRTLASQQGPNWYMPVNILNLPQVPEPQLAIVLRVRHKYSGVAYSISKVYPIRVLDPVFRLVELNRVTYTFSDNFVPLIVGKEQAGVYMISDLPKNSTSATLMWIGPKGDTVNRAEAVGDPYLRSGLVLLDTVYTKQWPGAQRMRATVKYDNGPADGHTIERAIPDSVPVPVIEASAGFGPFRRGVDQENTFVVRDLGPMCTALEWVIQYRTEAGKLHVPVRVKRAYDAAKDSAHFVYNMRDVSPGSQITVTAFYGDYVRTTQAAVNLSVSREQPVFRISSAQTLAPGVNRIDTVTIDSLPPRALNVSMILTSGSGAVIKRATTKRESPAYIRSAKLTFNAGDLGLGTYVVRVRVLNDFKDDSPDYFFGFDVRDTSKIFLIADSWGSYTQGDSATISPGVTDVRPIAGPKPDKVIGRFTLIDTVNPAKPIFASKDVDLSNVSRRDSVVYWPDESYVFGDTRILRARLQTAALPLSAHVTFERLIVRGTDTTRDNQQRHPVFVVPSPGTLSTSPRLDSVFIATRNVPLTVRLQNIIPEASAVRITALGTKDPDVVVQQLVQRAAGRNDVEWTFDAGTLPVNAKLIVEPLTSLSNDLGASITRLINTVPDTLSMTSIPPFDTLTLDWDIDPATQFIKGVARLEPTLTFSKIPAQTRTIEIVSYSDEGAVIDSVEVPVPYRTVYDPALTVVTKFPFRTYNTAALQVRYVSDGGPDGGIRYTRRVVSMPPQFGPVVQKLDLRAKPPVVDKTPIRQGSQDLLDLALRWRSNNPASTIGYAADKHIDSVRFEILDCASNILDQFLIRPTPPMTSNGVIADTHYVVTKLPLSAQSVRYHVYSKSLTLPVEGVTTTAPLTLRTSPQLFIPFGTSYPTYRVSDTTDLTLTQEMVITNLNSVYEIDSIAIVDRAGKTVQLFPALRPQGDTIRIPAYDFNNLRSDDAPYRILGLVRTLTCTERKVLRDTLAEIQVPRRFAGSGKANWVYSSEGWGPFQQGRAPSTTFVMSFSPASFIQRRGQISDSLQIIIQGYSEQFGRFSRSDSVTYSYTAGGTLPLSHRIRTTVNLNPFDTSASIGCQVRWFQQSPTGVQKMSDTLFKFPVRMLEFPDQPIDPDTSDYEQSVLAGSFNTKVMPSYYDFGMKPQSSGIDLLRFTMLSSSEHTLDTVSIAPVSRDTKKKTSVFSMQRDVAQYPWPYIAREREEVDIHIGYQFSGASKPTKIQKTAIRILPRAEWLNGSIATLDGTATATSIPISVKIPMPTSKFDFSVPFFGDINASVTGASDGFTDLVVKASYDPESREFTMRSSAAGGSTWIPTVSLFGGARYDSKNTANDQQVEGEFKALYRFVEAPLADESGSVNHRELRIRSLYNANARGVVGMLRWIIEIKNKINKLIKAATAVASGGLVHVEPMFIVDGSAQQVSTVNIGTEERGALLHLNEAHTVDEKTEPDEFPTSQAIGVVITGGGGIEASLLGLIDVGASITNDFTIASGSIFDKSVMNPTWKYYSPTLNGSMWFNLELSLFFGIVNIELFRGRLYHYWDKDVMPSFPVFAESWSSLFRVSPNNGPTVGQFPSKATLARLPNETPYYRPAPKLASNESTLMSVHVEHSLLGSSGRLVLSALDTANHVLRSAAVVADNRNGIHDPAIELFGGDGGAIVAWLQNELDVKTASGLRDNYDLLRTESLHMAYVDAITGKVEELIDVSMDSVDRFDGKPALAVNQDSATVLIAWPAMTLDSTLSDVFLRSVKRVDTTWQYGPVRRILRTPGIDRDVHVLAMDDGSYVISWINIDGVTDGVRVMAATVEPNGTITTRVLDHVSTSVITSGMEMVGNGTSAMLMFGRSLNSDVASYERSLEVYGYHSGTWSSATSVPVGSSTGLIRHVEAGLSDDGEFYAIVDGVEVNQRGANESSVIACIGSLNASPSEWKIFRNDKALSNPSHSIWSMSATVGPKRTLYVATQELDTIRDNPQLYSNGAPLGPARLNAVVRAVRLSDRGNLESVPFGNATTSVEQTHLDRLEAAMRYRVKPLDPMPNPVREACVVPLWVQRPTTVDVRLVDALGNHVATVFTGTVEEGVQGVSFETSGIASGHYSVVVTDTLGVAGSVAVVIIR